MRGMVALAIGIAAAAVFELDYTSRSASAVPGRPAAVGISPSAGLAAPDAIASEPGPDPGAVRPIGIDGGAPSLDELLSEFLDAVERRDTEAMNRLRLTKDEYQRIIIPGTVPPGQTPRRLSEQPREFFWEINDRKSRYSADAIAERYGGRHYESHELRLTHGARAYAWYTAHGQVRLALHAPDLPGVAELRTGSIAEVDGRYKFIAFQWND